MSRFYPHILFLNDNLILFLNICINSDGSYIGFFVDFPSIEYLKYFFIRVNSTIAINVNIH